jgi:hypothetical protein
MCTKRFHLAVAVRLPVDAGDATVVYEVSQIFIKISLSAWF